MRQIRDSLDASRVPRRGGGPVADTVLLVDFENVGKIGLDAIPVGVRVPFFFGASQKTVPTEFLKSALKLGDRFEPIDIAGHGKNASDFHIARPSEALAQIERTLNNSSID